MSLETRSMVLVPAKPRCSKCLKLASIVVQFMAFSSEHGAANPSRRGAKRTVRLCIGCVDGLRRELQQPALRPAARKRRAKR